MLEDRGSTKPLKRHLEGAGFDVAVTSEDPEHFARALTALLPPVAVVDVSQATEERVLALAKLMQTHPALRVVAVVGPRRDVAARCKSLGAWHCIRGDHYTARRLARLVRLGAAARDRRRRRAKALRVLTPKEREVLEHLANGADNLKIAALLHASERTVKVHVTSIYRKLGAQSRVELALLGRGLLMSRSRN